MQDRSKKSYWLFLSLLIIVLDQLSKYWVSHQLELYARAKVLPIFDLTLRYNMGAAFSFLSEKGALSALLFAGIAVVVSIVILIWLYRLPANRIWTSCALSLVLGGAMGNLIDRLLHGYVIDFLLFYINTWEWPAFNLADSAIVAGAMMLLIESIFFHKKQGVLSNTRH